MNQTISKTKRILPISLALASALASIVSAQQVIDTNTSAPLSLLNGESLRVTTSGSVSVSLAATDAITTDANSEVSIVNNGSINSLFRDGIQIGNLGALNLENNYHLQGDQAGIGCDFQCTVSSLNNTGTIFGAQAGIGLTFGNLLNTQNSGLIWSNGGSAIILTNSQNQGGGLIDGFRNTASGVIRGGFGTNAIYAVSINNFINEGQIGYADTLTGIFASNNLLQQPYAISNFTNAAGGVIRGTGGGVVTAGGVLNFTNHGTIDASGNNAAVTAAVNIGGALTNFTNTGLIENTRNTGGPAGWAIGVRAGGMLENAVNYGTIHVSNSGNNYSTQAGVMTEGNGYIASFTNAGEIFAEINVADPLNSGYAFREGGGVNAGGSTDLYLAGGSVLQGFIYLGSVGTDTIHVENGLNLATTIVDNGTADIIEAGGALFATQSTGNRVLIAVADTTALAAEDNALSAMSGALSGLVSDRLNADAAEVSRVDYGPFGIYGDDQSNRDWWSKGFGGIGFLHGGGSVASSNYIYGGLATGFDFVTNNGTKFGFMAGGSIGQVNVAIDNGQELNSSGFFVGGYGRYEAANFHLDYGLNAGYFETDSTRIVANNLVVGGLETATASYDSFYISPEATIGFDNWTIGALGLQPSLRLGYTFMQSEGYSEDGLTDGNLTVGTRQTHVIDARAQLTMPVRSFGPNTDFAIKAGIDAHFVLGGDFDATLLGVETVGFNPGGANFSASAFAGINVEHRINERSHLFFASEFGLGTETVLAGNIEAGIKISF